MNKRTVQVKDVELVDLSNYNIRELFQVRDALRTLEEYDLLDAPMLDVVRIEIDGRLDKSRGMF